ncbi:MAG TPA: amidohydrolase family protein [Dehalococcoidia bacterium]|nr:amidohydrolase family protein [Dehalococcoidia bacterium]
MDYPIISADDHIDQNFLPKDLWTSRVPEKYREAAPRVVETPDGPAWVCGGQKWSPWSLRPGQMQQSSGRRHALEKGGVLEFGVNRPTDTQLRLADMDRDGVYASVMYGPVAPLSIPDPDLRRVSYRAYNDWLAEFCATAPDRLIGVGLLPSDDPAGAADEVRHLGQAGIREGMLLAARAEPALWDPAWEPLWAAAAEASVAIGFHLSGGVRSFSDKAEHATHLGNRGTNLAVLPMQMDEPLAAVIFSGALERHPGLKIVLAETGIGWIPYFLERMDDSYGRFLDAEEYWRTHGGLQLKMKPSEYFKRQVWATFQIDKVGLRLLDVMGADKVMWASDYPHPDSTWPDSQKAIAEQFAGVSEENRRKVLHDNAKSLYGIGSSVRA